MRVSVVWISGLSVFIFAGAAFAIDEDTGSRSLSPPELTLARDLIDLNEYERAIEVLMEAMLIAPHNADIHNLLGYSHRKIDELEAAGLAYDSALEIDPNHLGALEYQGELFLLRGQHMFAQRNLAKLMRLCGEDCEAYQDLLEAVDSYKANGGL